MLMWCTLILFTLFIIYSTILKSGDFIQNSIMNFLYMLDDYFGKVEVKRNEKQKQQ